MIRDYLPLPPAEWKTWFRQSINLGDADEGEGQSINVFPVIPLRTGAGKGEGAHYD